MCSTHCWHGEGGATVFITHRCHGECGGGYCFIIGHWHGKGDGASLNVYLLW